MTGDDDQCDDGSQREIHAVLESQVRIQIVSQGYDPSIGYLHAYEPDRPALVLDLMEPLRPMVDRQILEFVQSHMFHPADFTIRADGVCRLNPEMARRVVAITSIMDRRFGNAELTFV